MNNKTLSVAVLALIGASAHRHHHHHPARHYNVQFVNDDYEEDNNAITEQSIAEAEKLHGAKMQVLDEDHYKQAIRSDNKLKFTGDEF